MSKDSFGELVSISRNGLNALKLFENPLVLPLMKKCVKVPDTGYAQPDVSKNFSSEEFIERIRARDNDAIEALVREYNKQLVNAATGLGFDINSACELVQNLWYTFFDIAPRFEGRSHITIFQSINESEMLLRSHLFMRPL